MATDKKFKIIQTIEDDAPCGDINWCTISFLTPDKIDKLKFMEIRGFKVHNGYNTLELANGDAKKIKEKNKNHDVYVAQLGKLYAWDDATKTDSIEYDDEKLNDLERNRRENIDKIKLLSEQFKNEHKNLHSNINEEKSNATRKKMIEKLHQKGKITQKEMESLMDSNEGSSKKSEDINTIEKIRGEIDECYRTDYLDENDPIGLKFGCVTIFSPKRIGGLKTLCLKIRGLYQTTNELNRRVRKLQNLYPNDRIHKFEIGKWCSYTDNDNINPTEVLKQLNYCMKCHIDNLEHEKEEFDKRKEKLQAQTEQESKIIREKNRKEKRREKLRERKRNKLNNSQPNNSQPNNSQPNNSQPNNVKSESITSFGNKEDESAIQNIIDYLDDPELRNKFAVSEDKLQKMEIGVN
jgi:hypothetical protein